MVLVLAGLGLQAKSGFDVVYAPTGLNKEVERIISRDTVHEFIRLLENYPQLNGSTIIDGEGNSLLHILAEAGQNEMIAITHFFSYGEHTVSIENNKGETPLDVAGDFIQTQRLLEAMGESTKGSAPITVATQRGDLESVKVLVKALSWKISSQKVEYRVSDRRGRTGRRIYPPGFDDLLKEPLKAAIAAHEDEIFNFLFDLALTDSPDGLEYANVDRFSLPGHYQNSKTTIYSIVFKAIRRNDNVNAFKSFSNLWKDNDTRKKNSKASMKHSVFAGAPNLVEFLIETGVWDLFSDSDKEKTKISLHKVIGRRSEEGLPTERHLKVLELLIKHGSR